MKDWVFNRIEGNNSYFGILTATNPNASDMNNLLDMMDEYKDLVLFEEDNNKMLLFDRNAIMKNPAERFMGVTAEDGKLLWDDIDYVYPCSETCNIADQIYNEYCITLTNEDLAFAGSEVGLTQ